MANEDMLLLNLDGEAFPYYCGIESSTHLWSMNAVLSGRRGEY